MHPASLRCSSIKYCRYSQSSRLAIRAPRPSRCDAGLPPRAARLFPWPRYALIHLGDRADALEDEALHPRAGVRFSRVEVSLRISGQVVDAEELARLPAAVSE